MNDIQVIKSDLNRLFSQIVSANLPRKDDEDNDTCGYRESDLKLEIRRASRMVIKRE